MNFKEVLFNKTMLSMFKDSKETFEEITENLTGKKEAIEKKIKKQIGSMDETTYWGIMSLIIIILILLPLGLLYIFSPETIENLFK